jgi:hypothetical protein
MPANERKMAPIPISAADRIAKEFGYDQVVIVARRVGEGGGEHVTTYGVNQDHCSVAAKIGNFFKHELMRWPREPQASSAKLERLRAIINEWESLDKEDFIADLVGKHLGERALDEILAELEK